MAVNGTTNTTNLGAVWEADQGTWQDTAQTTAAELTDPVERWEDQSGNSYDADQTTTANQPTVGSWGIEPDDSNDVLRADGAAAIPNGGTDITVYMAVELPASNPSTINAFLSFNNSGGSSYIDLRQLTNGNISYYHVSETDIKQCNGAPGKTGRVILTFIYTSGDLYIYVDGTEIASNTTGLTGTITLDGCYLFSQRGFQIGESPIAGIYVYSEFHDTTERGGVEDELTAYWISGASTQTVNPDVIAVSPDVPDLQAWTPGAITVSPDVIAVSPDFPALQSVTVGSTTQTVAPDVIAVNPDIPDPAVSLSLTVAPDVIAVSPDIPDPAVSLSLTVAPDVIAVSPDVPDPTARIYITIAPDVIAVSPDVPDPASWTPGAITVSPDVIAVNPRFPYPTIPGYATVSDEDLMIILWSKIGKG